MVLLGLILFTLTTQVIATPYGYSAKGGPLAAAKAEATANAAAFSSLPVIPLGIPNGSGGYSGSFSKSSSSSFASSSASSSSNSISFSGTGVNGINNFDINGGCSSGACPNVACSSGSCQNGASNGVNVSPQAGAVAGAAADADAFATSPYNSKNKNYQTCTGGNCNDNEENNGCTSGKCENKKKDNILKSNGPTNAVPVFNQNCLLGKCDTENQSIQKENNNDIFVNIDKKDFLNSNNNLPSQGSNPDQISKNKPSTPCYNGICKPISQTWNTNTNSDVEKDRGDTIPASNDCGSLDCGNSKVVSPSVHSQKQGYQKPSTTEPECSTHDCFSSSDKKKFDKENRPSSYNVPIFGTTAPTYFPEERKYITCTSTDCQDDKNTGTDSQSYLAGPNYNNNLPPKLKGGCVNGICAQNSFPKLETDIPNPQGECAGGKCTSYVPSSIKGESHVPASSNVCNGGVCTTNPHSSSSNGIPSTTSLKSPSYGTSSPLGYQSCSEPSCNSPGSTTGTQPIPASFNNPANCGASGCNNIPLITVPNTSNQHGDVGVNQPTLTSAHDSQTGFPGWVTQSTSAPYTSSANKYATTKSYLNHSYNSNNNVPTVMKPEIELAPPNYNIPTANTDGFQQKPNTQIYTGGFGGPKGTIDQNVVIKPHKEPNNNFPSSIPLKPTTAVGPSTLPSTLEYKPTYSGYSQHSQIPVQVSSITPISPSPDSKITSNPKDTQIKPENTGHFKPFESPNSNTSNDNAQVYTGGFGGSQGTIDQNVVIKPHKMPNNNIPSSFPSSQTTAINPYNLPSTPQYKPTYSGYGQHSQIPVKVSSITPISHSPDLKVTSNPKETQIRPENTGHFKPFESPNANTPNDNAQVYTGGFGGPQGTFDQNVIIKPHKTPNNNIPSSFPSSQTTAINPSNLPSTPQYKPTYSGYGQHSQIPVQVSSVTPISHATDSKGTYTYSKGPENEDQSKSHESPHFYKPNADAQVYTGNFGGPQGTIGQNTIIKPNNGNSQENTGSSLPSSTTTNVKPSTILSNPQFKPSYSGHNHHLQNTVPQPPGWKDTSSSKEIPYTGGFNGPSGFLKPNDFSIPSNTPLNSGPCTSSTCGSHSGQHITSGGTAYSGANGNAAASAFAYTAGFGGPPGLLSPYDDGKHSGPSKHSGINFGSHGTHGSTTSNLGYNTNQPDNVSQKSGSSPLFNHGGAAAQANAIAIASSSANSGSNLDASKGCSQGCVPSSSNGDNSVIGLGNDHIVGAIASAKSIAGATSFGLGNTFSSSSASAHASAGSATKGGYGRR